MNNYTRRDAVNEIAFLTRLNLQCPDNKTWLDVRDLINKAIYFYPDRKIELHRILNKCPFRKNY